MRTTEPQLSTRSTAACGRTRDVFVPLGSCLPIAAAPIASEAWTSRSKLGSVLVIVMITLLFATFALLTFMEKASVDLMVDEREAVTRRQRMEAYSALEMTLGVLNEFREASNGL